MCSYEVCKLLYVRTSKWELSSILHRLTIQPIDHLSPCHYLKIDGKTEQTPCQTELPIDGNTPELSLKIFTNRGSRAPLFCLSLCSSFCLSACLSHLRSAGSAQRTSNKKLSQVPRTLYVFNFQRILRNLLRKQKSGEPPLTSKHKNKNIKQKQKHKTRISQSDLELRLHRYSTKEKAPSLLEKMTKTSTVHFGSSYVRNH